MSKSESEARVELRVAAPEVTTEIFVVDSRFRRVASGLGDLSTEVAPGLYKVRFRSGHAQRDELVEVAPGAQTVRVTTAPLGFASAAPIAATRTASERHAAPAERESRSVHLHAGSGSEIFVFARDAVEPAGAQPWAGVSLHRLDGSVVGGLGEGHVSAADCWGALNLELDPGTYRLRVDSAPLGTFEMFVIACDGWQTQVFLAAADFQAGGERLRRAALKTAAVFMARRGHGFEASGEHVRLAELARQGLGSGRNVVPGEDLNALLRGKFENPMLGIYGAHLLAQAHRPDHALIDSVLANLEDLVAGHTDLRALALRGGTTTRSGAPEFPTPPMLYRSWELIVKDSLRRISAVPRDSATERLADGLLSSTPWLLHRAAVAEALGTAAPEVNFARSKRVLARLAALDETTGRALLERMRSERAAFSPLEQKIMAATLEGGRAGGWEPVAGSDPGTQAGPVPVTRILRNLDAPAAAIARSTDNLLGKLALPDLDD